MNSCINAPLNDDVADPLPPPPGLSVVLRSSPSPVREVPPPTPRRSPSSRPRSATITSAMMREAAAQAAYTRDLLGNANANLNAAIEAGLQVNRGEVTTPAPDYPSIAPALVLAPPPPFLPAVAEVHASAVIVTPQPVRPSPGLDALMATGAATAEARRNEKKRARLDTPSPSPVQPLPMSTARAPRGAIPRSNQTIRSRVVPTYKPRAIAPTTRMSPSVSYRRITHAATTAIETAVREARNASPGPSRLPPLTQASSTPSSDALRLGVTNENVDPDDYLFDMDMDVSLVPIPEGFGAVPPQALRRPLSDRVGPNGLSLTPSFDDDLTLVADSSLGNTIYPSPFAATDEQWQQLASPLSPPLDSSPLAGRRPLPGASTPSRPTVQSAAELAASFVLPSPASQPIPIPGNPAAPGGAGVGVATFNAAMPGVHHTHDGTLSNLQFTAAPPDGFPEVFFSEPDGVFRGLSQDRIDSLCSPSSEPAFVLQVHSSGFPPPHEVRPLTLALTAAVRHITGELNPLVVPPEREWVGNVANRENPFTWTVLGVRGRGVERVLDQLTWSANSVSFHASRPAIRIGSLMFVLGGFAHDHNGSILRAVWTVFTGDIVFPRILELIRSNPALNGESPEEAARAILGSLHVRVRGAESGNIFAAVFCDSPTQSIPLWREWRDLVASLPFPSTFNSTGFVRRFVLCAGCHSNDHPTHLCPFPDVPGWNAPPPGTTWGQRGAGVQQGPGGGAPPPAPPPGGPHARGRTQPARRTNSSTSNPPGGRGRDHRSGGGAGGGGGASYGGKNLSFGGGTGFGEGGSGAGSSAF